MKLYKTVPLLVAIVLLTSSLVAQQEKSEAGKEPQSVVSNWAAAYNSNDADALSEFYEQSKEIEMITSSGNRFHGYDAVQKGYVDDFKRIRFYDSKADKISTRVIGNVALALFEHQFKMEFKEDNSKWRVHIRTTSVLKRSDGRWKIITEHSSAIRGIERMTRIDN